MLPRRVGVRNADHLWPQHATLSRRRATGLLARLRLRTCVMARYFFKPDDSVLPPAMERIRRRLAATHNLMVVAVAICIFAALLLWAPSAGRHAHEQMTVTQWLSVYWPLLAAISVMFASVMLISRF